jgi:hypothetical protein
VAGNDDFSGVAAVSNRRESSKRQLQDESQVPPKITFETIEDRKSNNVTGATLQTLSCLQTYAEVTLRCLSLHKINGKAWAGKNGYSTFAPSAFFVMLDSLFPQNIRLLQAAKRCLVMPARREIRRTVGLQPAF